jgi:hypothetical protein
METGPWLFRASRHGTGTSHGPQRERLPAWWRKTWLADVWACVRSAEQKSGALNRSQSVIPRPVDLTPGPGKWGGVPVRRTSLLLGASEPVSQSDAGAVCRNPMLLP